MLPKPFSMTKVTEINTSVYDQLILNKSIETIQWEKQHSF